MNLKTKDLTVVGLLTALSILIPQISPTIGVIPFTATFASHVPVIISTFISPTAAFATAIGSGIGFAIKLGNPFVTARAFSHVFFAVIAAIMLRKKFNYAFVLFIAMFIHGIGEAFVAVPIMNLIGFTSEKEIILKTVLYGTFIHHCIDSIVSVLILVPLSKSKLIDYEFSKSNLFKIKGQQ